MFWCFSYWSPNRITSKLLSFILTVWGNHGRRESLRHVHLFVFTGDQAVVSARVYVPSDYVYVLQRARQPHFSPSVKQLWLGGRFWNGIKVARCHVSPRPVVPYSLSSTSKPTHPSTYNQKEIKWFIISSRLLHKVKTWKIKDRKGLSKNPCSIHFTFFPVPFVSLFLTE